jgi:hypothetical protein
MGNGGGYFVSSGLLVINILPVVYLATQILTLLYAVFLLHWP